MYTKTCSRCKIDKPIIEFAKRRVKKDGTQTHQPFCRECNTQYQKIHYANNREKYKQSNNERRQVIRQLVWEIKTQSQCAECPESHPACLDFHHKDSSQKDFTIADAVHRMISIENIKEEISKCLVLCSNCHRKQHYFERNHL